MSKAPTLRILVCGGREYADWRTMSNTLWLLHYDNRIALVIQGGAQGADAMARWWCNQNGVPCETYRASWQTHGKAAGPIRNQRMLDCGRPDLVIAFPGGRGTADMVRRARTAAVPVLEV